MCPSLPWTPFSNHHINSEEKVSSTLQMGRRRVATHLSDSPWGKGQGQPGPRPPRWRHPAGAPTTRPSLSPVSRSRLGKPLGLAPNLAQLLTRLSHGLFTRPAGHRLSSAWLIHAARWPFQVWTGLQACSPMRWAAWPPECRATPCPGSPGWRLLFVAWGPICPGQLWPMSQASPRPPGAGGGPWPSPAPRPAPMSLGEE